MNENYTKIIFPAGTADLPFSSDAVFAALDYLQIREFAGTNFDEVTYQEMPGGLFISNPGSFEGNAVDEQWLLALITKASHFITLFGSEGFSEDDDCPEDCDCKQVCDCDECIDELFAYADDNTDDTLQPFPSCANNCSCDECRVIGYWPSDESEVMYMKHLTKNNNVLFERKGINDYFFTSPEIFPLFWCLQDGSDYPDRPLFKQSDNWLWFENSNDFAAAVVAGTKVQVTEAQVAASHDDLFRFALMAINEELPEGFTLLSNGWLRFTNPEEKDITLQEAIKIAKHAQWEAVMLRNLFDDMAYIAQAHSEKAAQEAA